jgi:L-cystine transport system permease protein
MTWSELFDPRLAAESLPFILTGIWDTLYISLLSMLFGLILGFILGAMRSSRFKILRLPSRVYISFMRGMPMIVFLFLLYFGLPVVGIEWSALTSALVGFSLISAAYMAEIVRAAIASVPDEQWDAAKVFGASYSRALWSIILPQAGRIAIPSLGNVFLDLIKSSSLAAVISVPELFHMGQIVAGRAYDSLTMYFLIGMIYWVICWGASALQNYLEKRFPILN